MLLMVYASFGLFTLIFIVRSRIIKEIENYLVYVMFSDPSRH